MHSSIPITALKETANDYTFKTKTEQDQIMLIYSIQNKLTGKRYIGKTVNDLNSRIRTHRYKLRQGIKNKLYDAMRSYGESNFVWEIIETITCENINERERYYIKLYDSINNGYNITEGGEGGDTMSQHPLKRKIYANIGKKCSVALRGRKKSAEHVKQLTRAQAWRRGQPLPLEWRNNISKALLRKHPNKGKHPSTKTRVKIGRASKIRTKRVCVVCGSVFIAGRCAKYCSWSCRYKRQKELGIYPSNKRSVA